MAVSIGRYPFEDLSLVSALTRKHSRISMAERIALSLYEKEVKHVKMTRFGTCAGQMERAVKQTTLRLLFGNALPTIISASRAGVQSLVSRQERLLPQSSAVRPYDDLTLNIPHSRETEMQERLVLRSPSYG